MQEARAVYHAESTEQAKERLAAWSARWGEMAPESMATFERDFDATIAFYQLEGVALQWVRSTSLLERVNRQLRRKCASGSFLWLPCWGRSSSLPASSASSCSMEAHVLVYGLRTS
ncbi:MAG TPA: transposase [Ktedonobacteraceae bacterium]|jgi:transposase-like protein|nr:transposase [Ktedonobacteraceae bacterium]